MSDGWQVCFLSRRYFPTVSGMSVYADNLVRQLVGQGHGVTMLSQYYGGDAAGVYGGGPPPPVPGASVIGLESVHEQTRGDFESDIRAMIDRVVRAHADAGFDVIHSQYGYPTGLAGLLAARQLGLPHVLSIQGGDGHWVGECCDTHRRAMQQVCAESDAVIIGSDSFAREVHGRLGTPLDRFTIIPGAVDTARFYPRPGRTLGELASPPRLLYHGRVDRRKGVFELLDAYQMMRHAGRDLRLTVSGIGPNYQETRDRAAGIDGVHVGGHVDYFEAPARYREHDLFVSPTHAEGFSNTILEAMASGLPIVSCHAVGVVDCLTHGRNGRLARVADVEDLVAQIQALLDDRGQRAGLAETALADVEEHYAWTAIARRIAEVYTRVIGADPPAGFAPPTLDMRDAEPCRFRAQPHLL